MEKVAKCIKETSNWSKMLAEHRFDHPKFSTKKFLEDLPASAPKLQALLDKIKELDEADMKKHGKLFKHFIYSDIKSAFGAKLIASALAASGFEHAYGLEKTGRGMSFVMKKKLDNAFATLTSVSFFEKNVGINFRKDLLKVFNSRPDNINGEKIRIIILDSGFREGVDLFDIKYVHLFEPIITRADEKQAIGRATRFCGQKGLHFDRKAGWPIYVYKYETLIPKRLQHSILSDNHTLGAFENFFELFLKFSNIDPKKINFANDIEPLIIMGAVDRYLNRNIHNFSIKSEDDEIIYNLFEGGAELTKFQKMQKLIRSQYMQYAWPPTRIENGCMGGPTVGMAKGADTIVQFSPTQNFVRNFFTTKCPYKGMLLMHSVGTGKTCSAIAVASSSFEKDDYTIIYVTRHTLKGDVWKNMFGQSCSILIQDMIKKGVPIPEAKARRAKLINAWMEPMSYKQFSNMVAGKSQLYKDLVAKNGKTDPLKKTLIIIDEAHKLYAPDVAGAEKPDVDAIRSALHQSYQKSGKDSARLLLMTATPYTDDPLDMIKLLNLCREDSLPEDFEAFSERFLDKETGKFSEKGKWLFLDEITGYISYLNRERDVRSFSYPIFQNVHVPLSEYEFKEDLKDFIGLRSEWKNYAEIVKDKAKEVNQYRIEKKNELLKDFQEKELVPIKEAYDKCVDDVKKDALALKRKVSDAQKECKASILEPCKKKIKADLKVVTDRLKLEAKENIKKCNKGDKECRSAIQDALKVQLEKLKSDAAFETEKCNKSKALKKCLDDAGKVGVGAKKNVKSCDKLKVQLESVKKNLNDRVEKDVEKLVVVKKKNIEEYEKALKQKHKLLSEKQDAVLKKIKDDRSQQMKLETCLKPAKVSPMYDKMLKGKSFNYMEDIVIDENDEDVVGNVGDVPSNVYMINGHGGETVEDFNDRKFVMPNDKILVAFPVCGRPNYLDRICEFTDIFQDAQYNKILLNPLVFKAKIESMLGYPIRIYLPGDKVPNMASNLFMNFNLKKTVIMKSGVFKLNKIPKINRQRFEGTTDMKLSLGSAKCFKYTGILDDPSYYDANIHYEVFKGNVYKPAAMKNTYDNLEHRMIKIKDVMEEVGPGIYYFTGCRSSANIPLKRYEKILDNSAKQQEKPDRHVAIKGFHKKYIKGVTVDGEESPEKSPSPAVEERKEKTPKSPSPVIKPIPLKVLRNIKKELTLIMKMPLNDRDGILKKVEKWIETLSSGGPEKDQVLVVLTDLKNILTDDDSVKKTPVITVDKKGDLMKVYFTMKYTVRKKNYAFDKELVGVLPKDFSDDSLKCNSELIIKKLKKVFKNGKEIKGLLPASEDDWNNDPDMFEKVCKRMQKI